MEEIRVAQPELPGTGSFISLERGDILKARYADLLVISAFAGDYRKTKSSLIGQLWRSEPAIDVAALERTPATDLRGVGRTWLSQPLPSGAPASRLLCFESPDRGPVSLGPTPIDVIADLFRGLNTAIMLKIGEERAERKATPATVVTPIVASGDQEYPVEEIPPEFLDAAVAWIGQGVPLGRLRIIVHDDPADDEKWVSARRLFCAFRADHYRRQPPPAKPATHDVFLSYARLDSTEADAIVTDIGSEVPDIRIWRDTSDMEPGNGNWRTKCFCAIDDCRLMLCLLTSNYIGSKACVDEYAAGWCRQDRLGRVYQIPLPLCSCDLPSYLDSRMRHDCVEYDRSKLRTAYAEIKRRLAAP